MAIFLIPIFTPSVLQTATEHKLGVSIGEGMPAIVWISFGLQDSRTDPIDYEVNRHRLPGWYNGYTSGVWTEAEFDSEKAAEIAKKDLVRYASLRWTSSDHGLSFFRTKVESTWLEPTYQSLFFGALPGDSFFQSQKINDLYEGLPPFKVLVASLRGVSFVIFIGITGYQIFTLKKRQGTPDSACWILSTTFIGAFIFHLFWETKSAYVYPYIFMAFAPTALLYGHLIQLIADLPSGKSLTLRKRGDSRTF